MSRRCRPWIVVPAMLALVVLFVLFALFATSSLAAEVRPFNAGSLATIRAEQAGRPFVLVFWSATCLPCVKELPAWGRRIKRHPTIPMVLVNLDPAAQQAAAIEMASTKVGAAVQHWAMADEVPERVYWSVDPKWRGEAPFSILHDAKHHVQTYYGRISDTDMSRWYSRQ